MPALTDLIARLRAATLAVVGTLALGGPASAQFLLTPDLPPTLNYRSTLNHQSCQDKFIALRTQAEKRRLLANAAAKRKAPHGEICASIRGFAEAVAKVVEFVTDHASSCRMTHSAVSQIRGFHDNTIKVHNRFCSGGPGGPLDPQPRPQGPHIEGHPWWMPLIPLPGAPG